MGRSFAVLKFGGTSVGSVDSLRSVISIAAKAAREERIAAVASAASGVTDDLVKATGPDASPVVELLASLFDRHHSLARPLLSRDRLADYDEHLSVRMTALRVNLETAAREGTSPSLYDAIISEGERLMAPLVALCLSEAGVSAEWVDAAKLVRTDGHHGDAQVDFDATRSAVQSWLSQWPSHVTPVVTGFIGSTANGAVTTLGRSGSDYSAAVLAAALGADRLERWTDTDGIYTDDPDQIRMQSVWQPSC
jgi:aspartate kinase